MNELEKTNVHMPCIAGDFIINILMGHWIPADENYCSLLTNITAEGATEQPFHLNIEKYDTML